MPMIDAFIPDDALEPKAEAQLFNELTEILIRLEGFEPTNERARAATWIFLHRPKVFRAGSPSALPQYRFILSVPEGQYNDEICRAVIKEVTEAVARAESGTFEEVSQRVWVFPTEVPDRKSTDLPQVGNRGRLCVMHDAFQPFAQQAPHHAGTHSTQTDQSELH